MFEHFRKAVKNYTALEIKVQDTVGPSVASYFGGEWAGRGAAFWQKEFPKLVSQEEQLAVSNPAVGLPLLGFMRATGE